jgi:hypothetical protein
MKTTKKVIGYTILSRIQLVNFDKNNKTLLQPIRPHTRISYQRDQSPWPVFVYLECFAYCKRYVFLQNHGRELQGNKEDEEGVLKENNHERPLYPGNSNHPA